MLRRDEGPEQSWAAIHKIADEYHLTVPGGRNRIRPIGLIHRVAELRQKLDKLVAAAMNVADDVEGAVFGLLVIPEWVTFDGYGVHFLGACEHEDVADAFAFQSAQRTAELLRLVE